MSSPTSTSAASLRGWLRGVVWLVGVVACCAYYALGTKTRPLPTASGVDLPLFGVGDLDVEVVENRRDGRCVFAVRDPRAIGPFLYRPADPLGWPQDRLSTRRIELDQFTGTWRLANGALRRVSQFCARAWISPDLLWGTEEAYDRDRGLVFPASGGSAKGVDTNDVIRIKADFPDAAPYEIIAGQTLASIRKGSHRYYICWGDRERPEPIVAAGDGPAPRLIRLADRGFLVSLTRDERHLYFIRNGILRRLDMRQAPSEAVLR